MKKFFLSIFILTLIGCSKPKTVLICGDHVCINKSEAKQYFEENLSIEVRIIDKKRKKEENLVEVNLLTNTNGKKEVIISEKKNTKKDIKTLSEQEIINIKKNIKKKKKIAKKNVITKNQKQKNISSSSKNLNNKKKDVVDICTILKDCSIDEISKYLLMQGKKKDFPDITSR